jgi:hypothetical protein
MKQITIGFSKSNSWDAVFSWLILLTQKTPYSHVYLKYTDEVTNNIMYWQASHTLVNSMDSEVFLGQETVIQEFTFQVSDAAFVAWMDFCEEQDGKPYGVLEIFGLAAVQLASLVGIKITNPIREAGETWICDQVIAAGLAACENITLPTPLDNMRPQDVYALVQTLPPTLS